jgi:hypothetical protein
MRSSLRPLATLLCALTLCTYPATSRAEPPTRASRPPAAATPTVSATRSNSGTLTVSSSVAARRVEVRTKRDEFVRGCAVTLRKANVARYAAAVQASAGSSPEAARAEGEYVFSKLQTELEDGCRCFIAELATDSLLTGNANFELVSKARAPACVPPMMEAIKEAIGKVDIEAYRARVRSGQP